MKKYILTSVCEENLEVSVEGVFDTHKEAYAKMKKDYEDEFEGNCEEDEDIREELEDSSDLSEDSAMLGWGVLDFAISWEIHEIEV